MKLRTTNNSIRLRLNKDDVETMRTQNCLCCTILFPGEIASSFSYSLIATDELEISMNYLTNHLRVYAPTTVLSKWYAEEEVGFSSEIITSGGDSFKILVEKDFQCLSPRAEDESRMFPNPNKHC